jgi:hypothetical protein
MIDTPRRLFHPTSIMAFQQFLELGPGTLLVAGTVLHVKIEPLALRKAAILTELARGSAATLADTAFVDAVAPNEARVLDNLVDRAGGRSPPNFHPDYQPSTPVEDYFVGPDGFAYAFGAITRHIQTEHAELQGALAFV